MRKVVSIILVLLMLVNTALAYTSTVIVKGIGISVTSDEGSAVEIVPKTSEITGWTVKSGNTTVTNNQFVMPAGNVVIEGVTKSGYTLIVEMPHFTRVENKTEGESITIEATTTNEGYTFKNWTATGITLTSSQQTSKTITFTMPGNDVKLVANYVEGSTAPETYTITYNVNSGTGTIASQTKTKGVDLTLTTDKPTRSGYNFLGWSTSSSATSAEYASGGTFTTDANTTLYAVWSQNSYSVTVTKSPTNGGTVTGTGTKTYGSTVTLKATPATGYSFTKWEVVSGGATLSSTTSTTTTFIMPASNLEVEAIFEIVPIIENSEVALGAYIQYMPNKTTATVSGSDSGTFTDFTFNPSSTTSWRVLENKSGQLDIISTEKAVDLTLKGQNGYRKGVYTLKLLCNEYVNPEYATGARNPGYTSSSMDILEYGAYTLDTNAPKQFPYHDTYYSADRYLINVAKVCESTGYIWLSSRRLHTGGGWHYSLERLEPNGMVGGENSNSYGYGSEALYSAYYDSSTDYSSSDSNENTYGVRPIVSLRPEIKIISGDGTSSNPYVISK